MIQSLRKLPIYSHIIFQFSFLLFVNKWNSFCVLIVLFKLLTTQSYKENFWCLQCGTPTKIECKLKKSGKNSSALNTYLVVCECPSLSNEHMLSALFNVFQVSQYFCDALIMHHVSMSMDVLPFA